MSENTTASSLLENCKSFNENVTSLAKEQSSKVNNRALFLQSLVESSIDRIIETSRNHEDLASARSLVCDLLKLEIKKFVDEKSAFDQTLGKIVVTSEIIRYIEESFATESEKDQKTINRKIAEARVKERIEKGDDLTSQARKPGEHPEKLRDVRNLQGEKS